MFEQLYNMYGIVFLLPFPLPPPHTHSYIDSFPLSPSPVAVLRYIYMYEPSMFAKRVGAKLFQVNRELLSPPTRNLPSSAHTTAVTATRREGTYVCM